MLPADYLWCTLFCCRIERTVREHLMTLRSRFITRWNRHATRKLHSLLPRYTTHYLLCEVCFLSFHKSCKSQSQRFLIKSCMKTILLLSFPDMVFTEQVVPPVVDFTTVDTLFHSSACNLYSEYFYIPNPPSQFTLLLE